MFRLLSKYRKCNSLFVLAAFFVWNTGLAAVAADISTTGVPFATNTAIGQSGNTYTITTQTAAQQGALGINSFSRFNVNHGDIVNLQLLDGQNKLVNLIFDSSASQINGIVNSYLKNGLIGGNILFANPHGFVVGKNGVFNVGSLTLMTPTEDAMKNLFSSDYTMNETNVERLISFTFDDNDYLIGGNEYYPVQLQASPIEINGTINSGGGLT